MKPEDVEKAVLKRLKGCKGQLLVHDLSTLTPSMVERDLVSYKKKGIFPDLIVVDYADIMTPDTRSKERRHEFSSIYNGLRAIAKKENVAIWTASQSNRASFKKNTMKMDDIAEDWGKAMIADYIIGLSQSDIDRKAKPQKMRLALVKNRNGEKGIVVDTRVDFSRMRMHVVVSAEEAEEEKELYGEKKEKIRELIKEGRYTVEEVMDKTGCKRRYYFKVKEEMEKEKNPSEKVG
jgi:replicative DNA helicase